MFTRIALEGRFTSADGSPASGTITVTPNSFLVNDGLEGQSMGAVSGVLDSEGRISINGGGALVLNATDDDTTSPSGSSYAFALKLDGRSDINFSCPVPSDPNTFGTPGQPICIDTAAIITNGSPTVLLVNLIASASMIGSHLSAGNISESVIISVDEEANTVTCSNDATSTGTTPAQVIGGCVNFFGLQANAL